MNSIDRAFIKAYAEGPKREVVGPAPRGDVVEEALPSVDESEAMTETSQATALLAPPTGSAPRMSLAEALRTVSPTAEGRPASRPDERPQSPWPGICHRLEATANRELQKMMEPIRGLFFGARVAFAGLSAGAGASTVRACAERQLQSMRRNDLVLVDWGVLSDPMSLPAGPQPDLLVLVVDARHPSGAAEDRLIAAMANHGVPEIAVVENFS